MPAAPRNTLEQLLRRPAKSDTTGVFALLIAAISVTIVAFIVRAVRLAGASIARAGRDIPLSRPDVVTRVVNHMRSVDVRCPRCGQPTFAMLGTRNRYKCENGMCRFELDGPEHFDVAGASAGQLPITFDSLSPHAMLNKNQDGVARIVGLILLLAGLGLLAGSAHTYRQQAAFVDASQKAAGVVVANDWRESRIQGGDETPGAWAPVVRYEDAGGNLATFTSEVGNYPSPAYSIGEEVEVLYDPEDPGHAEIGDFMTLWLIPVVLFGIGIVMAVFGGILLRSAQTA